MKLSEIFTFVPSFNHAPFIERCLQSIINQTLKPSKLLVIDDGSTDGSPDVIEKVLKNCSFDSELIVRKNRGLCRTLNEALEKSAGKYFAYLGSDDIWAQEFLAERFAVLEKREKAVLAYGHAFLINAESEVFDSTKDHAEIIKNYADGDAKKMLLQGIAPVSSTVMYRREALAKFGWNEDSYLEDYELYLKLSTVGEFAFDSQILSFWRQHENNASGDKKKLLAEVTASQERNLDLLGISQKDFEKIKAQTEFRFARQFLQQGGKREAAEKGLKNWRGASSKTELLNFGLRLLIPMSIVNKKRNRRKKKYIGDSQKTENSSNP